MMEYCTAEFGAVVLFISKFICYFAAAVVFGFLIAMIVDKFA